MQANIRHTGDTGFNGFCPFVDYRDGGSLDGMLAASARNLASADDQTIIVPGHGAVGDKANVSVYFEMIGAGREKVATVRLLGDVHAGRTAWAFSRRPVAWFGSRHLRGLPVLVHEVSRRVWGL